jgi:large repetitive protein
MILLVRSCAAVLLSFACAAVAVADPFPPYWTGGAGAAVHYAPVGWPSEASWTPYSYNASDTNDAAVSDPSNGGTSPQNYVNVSSGCADQTLPSIYYYFDNATNTLMFRWRVGQIANTYATGPSAGPYAATDPWRSALWTVLIDIDGDGFREFAVHLNGSSGDPSEPIDVIRVIYSDTPSQSIDYLGDPANIFLVSHNPTAFVDNATDRILNFQNSLTPVATWPNGSAETVWDYGTTRAVLIPNVPAHPCDEYFIDYQIPLDMLDATSVGGPAVTPTTPMSLAFTTANSLQNPLQKDVVIQGAFTGDPNNPIPTGDTITPGGGTVQQPTVQSITANGCNLTTLRATISDTMNVATSTTTVTSADFYYYRDNDADGDDDDGNAWTLAASGTTNNSPVGLWTATWNSTALLAGQYLIGVRATDQQGNITWSYLTAAEVPAPTPPNYSNPGGVRIATFTNSCGTPPPSLIKSANVSEVTAGGAVTFTLTVNNTSSAPITVSSISDILPTGFTYASTGAGSLGAPTTSPTGGASGTITWTFPNVPVPAADSRTLIFTANAPLATGNYANSATAVTSYANLTSNVLPIAVGAPRLTIQKAASVASANPGGTITYTITYANDSPVAVTNAVITDVLPAGLTFVSSPTGVYNGGTNTITWNAGSLGAGDGPFTVSFVATVDNPYPNAAAVPLVNTASIDSDQTAPANASTSTYIAAPRPAMLIQKSSPVTVVAAGADVTYTITYTNAGNAAATGVTITDPVPAGFTYQSASVVPDGAPAAGFTGTLTWTRPNLAAGASSSFTVTLRPGNPYSSANPQINTATIDTNETTPVSDSWGVGVIVSGTTNACFAPISGLDTSDASYTNANLTANDNVYDTYSAVLNTVGFTAGNYQQYNFAANLIPATNVVTAATVTYVFDERNLGNAGDNFGGRLDAYVNGTASGQQLIDTTVSQNAEITTNVNAFTIYGLDTAAEINNNLSFRFLGWTPCNAGGCNSQGAEFIQFCVTHAAAPTLVIDKEVSALTVSPGGALTYTLHYGNLGPTGATGVVVTDTLPAGVSANGPLPPGCAGSTGVSGATITCTVGALAASSFGTFTLSVTVAQPLTDGITLLTNNVTIDSDQTAPDSDSSLTAVLRPSVTITKAANDTFLIQGETVTYTLHVLNSGSAQATNVTVTDVLPATAYFSYVPGSAQLNGVAIAPDPVAGGTLTTNIGTLAVGASADVTYQMLVGPGAPAGVTTIDNDATVSDAQTSGTRTSNLVTVSISTNPILNINKTSSPAVGTLAAGDRIDYTVVVQNSGSGAASGVVITDVMPANTTYIAGTLEVGGAARTDANDGDNARFDAGTNSAIFAIGALASGASVTVEFSITINSPLAAGSYTITNTAVVSASNAPSEQDDTSIAAQSSPLLTIAKDAPDNTAFPLTTLAANAAATNVIMVASSAYLTVGDYINIGTFYARITGISGNTVTLASPVTGSSGDPLRPVLEYFIRVENVGAATATGVVVSDPLPAGTVFVAAEPAATTAPAVGANGTVTWNAGSLDPEEVATFRVYAAAGAAGTYTNTATVDSSETTPVGDSAITSVGVLAPSKVTSTPATTAGSTARYTITIANQSTITAQNVQVTDALSAGFTFAANVSFGGTAVRTLTINPAAGDEQPQWGLWDIPAGGTLTITFDVDVDASVAPGTYQNEVSAASTNVSALEFDFLSTVVEDVVLTAAAEEADLSLDKSVDDDTPILGQNVIFTIAVANEGPDEATGVQVEDVLPAGLSYVSDNGGGAYVPGTGIWTAGTIASGGSASLQITATVIATGSISNYAQVSASGLTDPDSTPNDDSIDQDDDDTQALTVPASSDLSLDKSVDDATPDVGQNVVFTVTLTNSGPDAATGVQVRDLLPAGLTYVSDNGGGAYVPGTGIWTVGAVGNGGTPSLQITATVIASGTLSNYAQVIASSNADPDSTPNDNSINQDDDDSQDLTVPAASDLSLDKSVDDATPTLGQNVVFTITVSNAGPDAATGVTVEDLLPAGLTYVSDNGGGAYVPGTGIWTVGGIASPGSASLQITATVTATGTTPNYAQVAASGTFDPDSQPNDDSTGEDDDDTQNVIVGPSSDLELEKSVDDATVTLGQNVVFTITVTNDGPDHATAVVVEDLLPAGLTYVSDNGGGAYVPGTGVWTIGAINNGFTASLQITATATAAGTLVNYAQVMASGEGDPDSTPNDDSTTDDDDDSQNVIVGTASDLSLDKSVDDATPSPGQNVVFTLIVDNDGPDTATGITVRDLLPAGLTHVSNDGGGAYVPGTGVWTIPSIASLGSATLNITATVTGTGTISNYAQITASSSGDPDSTPNDDSIADDDDDTQDITVASSDLSVDKSVDDATPDRGQNVVFTITVSNAGPDMATGVQVTDVLPAGLSYVSDNGGGAYIPGTGVWTVPPIESLGSASLQITANVTATGMITNYAQVTASANPDPDSTPNDGSTLQDDDDQQDLIVPLLADLSLEKSVDDATPTLGQNVVFTVTVTNNGPDHATGVTVEDLLPAGLTYVSDNGGGAYVPGTGIWTIGAINNGITASLQITATMSSTGTHNNYAQIIASSLTDPDSTPNDDSTTQDDDDIQSVTTGATADLSLDKSVDDATPTLGQTVVFTLAVLNGGPDTATGVTVRDLLPAGLTYVSDNGGGAYNSGTGIWTVPAISSGLSASLQITATVTGTGVISNYAQVATSTTVDPDSTPNDDSTTEDDDDSQIVTVASSDLSLDKSVDDATPDRGQNVVFTITVSNAGPDMATGVQVTDVLPAGLSYVSDNGGGAYVPGTGVWTVPPIESLGSAALQITANVTATGMITNYAQVTASANPDPDSTPNDGSTIQDDDDLQNLIVPLLADLSLEKSVDDATPTLGQNVVFTVTVTNNGPDHATGVTVEDLLPAGLTYVSDNGGGAYVPGTGIWTIGAINNGITASLQITATMSSTGTHNNYAQVIASGLTDPDSTPNDDSTTQDDDDIQSVTTGATADLSLDKSVDDATPALGQTVVFTIAVLNGGPDTATGVTVRDLLPAGLTYVSDNGGGAYNSGTGIWTVPAISSGLSASLQITATVTGTGVISNYAQVATSTTVDPDSTPNDDSTTEDDDDSQIVTVAATADLSLDKSVDDATPALGQNVTFTITVSNDGPDTATGVSVADLLPAGLTYVSDNGGGAYNSGTGVWTIGSILDGASPSLQIVATVTSSANITNAAQVRSSDQIDPDSTPGNSVVTEDDYDTASVGATAADLSLAKTVNTNTPALNGNVTFTITVSNAGPNTATNVTVRDVLPAGLQYVSSSASTGAYDNVTGIWTIPSIAAPNGTQSLQIVATVVSAQNANNTAQIMSSDQVDPDSTPGNDNSTEDDQQFVTLVVQEASIEAIPTASELGLLLLGALLALAGAYVVRR